MTITAKPRGSAQRKVEKAPPRSCSAAEEEKLTAGMDFHISPNGNN
jgi:hypothetical protein